jgi:hypothetical protein
VTGSRKIFKVGCHHLIHGKTTILRVDHDTPEQQRGLSEATPSRNGNCLDRVRFYGFMGNVSPPTPALWRGLIVSSLDSRCRKESLLVRY